MKRFIIALLTIVCFASCQNSKKTAPITAGQAVQIDALPGQCPYLTKDAKGMWY